MANLKPSKPDRLIALGASTGGPAHIAKILAALPALPRCALLVAQHMNPDFIPSFITRLDHHAPMPVLELVTGMSVEEGKVYICTGKTDFHVQNQNLQCSGVTPVNDAYNPDIDHLFAALAPYAETIETLGVILTGIGEDGAEGCRLLAERGARCIAESEKSAIVYGMPLRARERIPGISVEPLEKIIESIQRFTSSCSNG
jgi:two-component system, chemotaxis family, protein-glutamate methylesterase/glutaminase